MIRTRVGYAGGSTPNPTYHHLGDHAETVQIDYDPARISFIQLLGVFWENHYPSMPSWSRQYMSAVFYHDGKQKDLALKTKEQQAAEQNRQIFTEIIPYSEFYVAEDYHQKYALQHDVSIMQEFKAMYPSFDKIVTSTAAARVNGYLGGYGSRETLREEIESYGLSRSSGTRLLNTVASACRIHCAR